MNEEFNSNEGLITFKLNKAAFKGDSPRNIFSLEDEEGSLKVSLEDMSLVLKFSHEETEDVEIKHIFEAQEDYHTHINWNIEEEISLFIDGDVVETVKF
jgi:Ca2+-binding EF-hand superfamily protein